MSESIENNYNSKEETEEIELDSEEQDPQKSTVTKMAHRIMLFTLGLCIAYCCVETVIILTRPQPLSLSIPGLNRGAFTEPGVHRNVSDEFDVSVHVNRAGFVDKDWGAKWSNQKRILLLGDSFVQAAQVDLEEGIGRQLEAKLNAHNYPADVLSIGVPGAGTTTAFELLKKYNHKLRPDTVILAFLVANDILNNHHLLESKKDKLFYTFDENQLVIKQYARPAKMNFWWNNSHSYRYVYRELKQREEIQQKLDLGNGVPIDLYVHADNDDPIWEEAWHITNRIVEEMIQFCQDNNINFRVMLIPVELQISPEKVRETKRQWPETAEWNMGSYAITRAYVSFLGEKTPVLNLYKDFKKHDSPSDLYFAQDGHWNAQGHELAARLLANWIIKQPKSAITPTQQFSK